MKALLRKLAFHRFRTWLTSVADPEMRAQWQETAYRKSVVKRRNMPMFEVGSKVKVIRTGRIHEVKKAFTANGRAEGHYLLIDPRPEFSPYVYWEHEVCAVEDK
jgi:hypothetical protein